MNEIAEKLQIVLNRESENHLVVDLTKSLVLEKHPISEDPKGRAYFVLIHEIERLTLECVFWDGMNFLRDYNSGNVYGGGFPVSRNGIDYWCYMDNQRGIESPPGTAPKAFLYCAYCHKPDNVFLEMMWQKEENDEVVFRSQASCKSCHKKFGDIQWHRIKHELDIKPVLIQMKNDWPYENTKIDDDVLLPYLVRLVFKI